MAKAYRLGAKLIIINPGLYLLPATGRPTFELNRWKNVTISAYHVVLMMHVKHGGNCFQLDRCRDVTIAGPTISQTRVTFYQGRISSIAKDQGGWSCRWRPDEGYPFPAEGAKNFPRDFDVVNASTRRLRVGSGDIRAATFASAGRHAFRLTFRTLWQKFKVGDWLVARWGRAFQKVMLNHSRRCTIKDVTMKRNGFAPIFEVAGGANRLIACRWVLGPPPPGASTLPVVTNQADGFHCVNAYPGPDIERCVTHGVFLDDCIAIHGEFQRVIASTLGSLTVKDNRNAMLTVGQPIQISNSHGFFAASQVRAIARKGNASIITLSRNIVAPIGAFVTNPLRCGWGYKVLDCRIGDTRSRGMLLKASDGLVRGNIVRGCGMAGISIGPEYWWHEAGYCRNVLVENNTLIDNGKGGLGAYYAAVYIHGDAAMGNSRITVRNNRFIGNYSGAVAVEWCRNSLVACNVIDEPAHTAFDTAKLPDIITISHSHHVTLEHNQTIAAAAAQTAPARQPASK